MAEQCNNVLRGTMPDRDIAFIRDPIYYQYTKIIPKSTFAGAGGESRLKHRGDKKFYDSIPPVPSCFSMAKPFLWVGR